MQATRVPQSRCWVHDRRVQSEDQDSAVVALVRELARQPRETPWLEFKENLFDPPVVGQYVSALANAAVLAQRARAYVVWGVRDDDHAIVGTSVNPLGHKIGNEDVQNWLARLLAPQVRFEFRQGVTAEGQRLVVLEIESAGERPVAFQGTEFIRLGSYKKKLKDHPEVERQLWRAFERRTFESGQAVGRAPEEEVVRLLDYPAYFDLLGLRLPEGRAGIVEALVADKLVARNDDGTLAVTNLGAVLFARDLTDFPHVQRKAARVVQYRGSSRVETVREQTGRRGYAAGFSGLIGFLAGLLPENEIIGQALRRSSPLYPELAIRELVANALIHQDFTLTGTGPMVELFEDRLEITNPGTPLIEPERFVDSPPQSRNEALAAMLRRIGVCEERGSGWDKVLFEVEFHQLPPPLVEVTQDHTRATLFAPRSLTAMDKSDRIRAMYQHACLKWVSREHMTNTTVRQRFGIADRNAATASRLLREALDAAVIAAYDPEAGPRALRYVPWWAAPDRVS